jgi:serine/threonine protein kinase
MDLFPIGTARYASINAQSGFELSRRDDLESLSYILIYFLRGSLPWQDLPGSTRKKQALMLQMKKAITPHILCEGLPVEFELILNHARNLKFTQRPRYQYLRGLVRKLLSKQESSTADWEVANTGKEEVHIKTPVQRYGHFLLSLFYFAKLYCFQVTTPEIHCVGPSIFCLYILNCECYLSRMSNFNNCHISCIFLCVILIDARGMLLCFKFRCFCSLSQVFLSIFVVFIRTCVM